MAIVVEDGSIVAGANSYLSLEDVRAFALARGVTLSTTDATVEAQLIKASDYIEAREAKFVGCRVSEDQVLCWPRYAHWFRSDTIPAKIVQAQAFLVMAQAASVDIVPIGSPPDQYPISREKVGPLETAYAVQAGPSSTVATMPTIPAAEEALAYYYSRAGARIEAY